MIESLPGKFKSLNSIPKTTKKKKERERETEQPSHCVYREMWRKWRVGEFPQVVILGLKPNLTFFLCTTAISIL
jgi:hypothetical protein